MKRIVVNPCDEDSTDITLYVSELDDFVSYGQTKNLAERLNIGKIFHTIILSNKLNGFGDNLMDFYLSSIENKKDLNFILNSSYYAESLHSLDALGLPCELIIELGPVRVKLAGVADGYYEDNGNVLVELKGYTNMPTEFELSKRYQLLACAMILGLYGKEIDTLEWRVFDKKNPAGIFVYKFPMDNINAENIVVSRVIHKLNTIYGYNITKDD